MLLTAARGTPPSSGSSTLAKAPGDIAVFATAPVLTQGAPSPVTFTGSQAGNPLRLAEGYVNGGAVAVVLAADASTSSADYLQARLAAHELLLGLPASARNSLLLGSGRPTVLSPLSDSKTLTAAALQSLHQPQGARSDAQAVLLAVQELPAGGHVVLLDDASGGLPPRMRAAVDSALSSRGVTLDRIGYGPHAADPVVVATGPAAGPTGGPCTLSPAGQDILSRVDLVSARITSEYRLDISGATPTRLLVTGTAAGTRVQAALTAQEVAAAQNATSLTGLRPAKLRPLRGQGHSSASGWSVPSWSIDVLLLLLSLAIAGLVRRGVIRQLGKVREARPGTPIARRAALGPVPTVIDARLHGHRGGGIYPDVDVAIVQESTYPYLKGGVSAVVHDIITGNRDLTFGIIHLTWDSESPSEDLYGMPENVKWVRPVFLSMTEHREDFSSLTPADLGMSAAGRAELSTRLFDALQAVLDGHMEPMWQLYDEGMNPRTRSFPLWAVFGSQEFMAASRHRLPDLGLPLVATFWLLREFFSLACAVLGNDLPRASVYHAHTTGYASLLGAAAARQNNSSFLLTEHNLYVRDTVNFMLERSMALTLKVNDWREFDVSVTERAWMAWWIEMGRFCYPSAEVITYLYPRAIGEAADLGAPVEKSVIIPNGMIVREFELVSQQRREALPSILADDPQRVWRLVYIARVVPIKGLADLISTVALLVDRGITNFHLDILGPTDHHPAYYMMCREKARTLLVEEYLTFRGTVNVRELLGEFDLLVLPSYNEGQPIVVLEGMTAGIPTVGTDVGGMGQLIHDDLTTPGGRTYGPCGLLVRPDYVVGMADALQTIMRDPAMYAEFAESARGRVANFFQLEDAMGAYNRLYRELGGLEQVELEGTDGHKEVIDLTSPDQGLDSTTGSRGDAAGSDQTWR